MVAIVGGNALGLGLGSAATLAGHASRGVWGGAAQGRSGEGAFFNAATGNLVLQGEDDRLAARGMDVATTRTYNSQGLLNDDNRDNWSVGVYDRAVRLTGDRNAVGSTLTRIGRDGGTATYAWDAARALYVGTAGAGAHDTIVYEASSRQWLWIDGDTGLEERYETRSYGWLVSSRDPSGVTVTYAYNPSTSTLQHARTSTGETVYYDYDGRRLTQIRSVALVDGSPGTVARVRYGYDADDRLTSVAVDLSPSDGRVDDGHVSVTRYTYDGASRRVASVLQADGSGLRFTYVQAGTDWRVATVTDALEQTTSFVYDLAARTTAVTGPTGAVTRYAYDAEGRIVRVAGPLGRADAFEWDASGNLVRTTDGEGRAVDMAYDADGNQTFVRDAAGTTVERTFSAANLLLTETAFAVADPDGAGSGRPSEPLVTRQVWDAAGRRQLRFVLSAEGRVVEHRYDGQGQRVATIAYARAPFAVGTLGATQVPSEAEMAGWAAAQDRTRTQRTDHAYDLRGRIQTSTTYAAVDANGDGVADAGRSVVRHVHDPAGRLLQTIAPDGGVTETTYDGLGRVLAVRDARGATTTTRYDDAGATVAVTLADGLVATRVFDRAGRLVSVVESADGVALGETRWFHDADGRLRMTQDPTGVRQWVLYDEAGREAARVDGDGTLTEYAYDRSDRLTRTVVHATCIDTAALVDADGHPTDVPLAALRPAATAEDRTSWRAYDAAGRLAKTVDASGAVVESFHDGAGRLVRQVAHADRVDTAALGAAPDAASIAPGANAASDRATRWIHDGEGRVVGVLDAEGFLLENRYDAGGRLASTTRYATATPVAQRLAGSLAALRPAAHADDQTTTLLHDATGRVVGIVDAEGHVTEKIHDADGRLAAVIRYANRPSGPVDASATVASLRPAADAEDRVTAWRYDALGRTVESTDAEGTVTRFVYDEGGRLVATETAHGQAEVRTLLSRFDRQGRLVGELSGEGGALLTGAQTQEEIDAVWARHGIAHAYDAAGRRVATTDANGNRTLFFHDLDGRVTHTVDALGEVEERTYDAFGQLASTVRLGTRIPLAGLTGGRAGAALTAAIAAARDAGLDTRASFTYTATGVLATSTDALGAVVVRTVDAFGDTVSVASPTGAGATRTDTTAFDRRGLAVRTVRDAGGMHAVEESRHDAFGRLVRQVDANGNVRTQAFDRAGRLVQSTDPAGAVRTTTYDAFDRVLVQTDAFGHATTTSYDRSGRSVTVTTAEGVSVTTTRTRHGEVATVRDGRGQTTEHAYDRNGNLVRTVDPLGHAVARTFDGANRLVETTGADGTRTVFAYDAADRVLARTVDPGGLALTTTYAFDAKGQRVRVTDPAGTVTVTAHDAAGRAVRQVVDPDGLALTTSWTWSADGRQLTATDAVGTVTAFTYDALGRRTREQVDPAGLNLARSWTYDANGNVATAVDGAGHVRRFVHDALDRVIWSIDASGSVERTAYDAEGRVAKTVRYAAALDPARLPTPATDAEVAAAVVASPGRDAVEWRRYDRDGRLRFTVDGTGSVRERRHDANGNAVAVVDRATPLDLARWDGQSDPVVAADPGRDRWTRTVYDALGRPTHVADAVGGVVESVFDAAGRIVARIAYATAIDDATPPNGAVASADDRVTRVAYDAAGRAVFEVDALGGVSGTTHDAAGRATAVREYAAAIAVSGHELLDAAEIHRRLAVDPTHDRTVRRVHDAAGRLVLRADAMGGVTRDVLDAEGRTVVRVRYATAIGEGDAVDSVVASPADRVERIAHDAAGRRVFAVDALGAVVESTWDGAGRVVAERAYATPVALPADAAALTAAQVRARLVADAAQDRRTLLQHDAAGRVVQRTTAAGTGAEAVTRSRYDALGRLVAQVDARGMALATSDSAWARAERERLGAPADASALDSAQRQALLDRSTTTFTHDAAGRILSTSAPTSTTASSYDAFGNAVRVVDPRGGVGTFWFDRLGRVTLQVDPAGHATETRYAGTMADKVASVRRYAARVGAPDPGVLPSLAPSAEDATTVHAYDKAGRLVRTQDAAGAVESVVFGVGADRFARRVTNKLGGTATFAYDKAGRQVSETLPVTVRNGASQAAVVNLFAYDAFGDRVATVEAAGLAEARTTTYRYDAAGRVTHRIGQAVAALDATSLATSTATPVDVTRYNAFGDTVEAVARARWTGSAHAGGARTLTYVDTAGRAVATVAPDGALTVVVRDPAGDVWKETAHATRVALPASVGPTAPVAAADPLDDRVTTFVHDAAGRLVETRRDRVVHWEQPASLDAVTLDLEGTQPETIVLGRTVHDAAGNAVETIDARGNSTFQYVDAIGRTVLRIDAEGYATAFEYGDLFDTATREIRYATRIGAHARQDDATAPPALRDPEALRAGLGSADDRITVRTFDRAGRVRSSAVLGVVQDHVDASGARVRRTADAVTEFTYDGLGLVTRQRERVAVLADGTTDLWNTTDTVHDALGRQVERREPGFVDHEGVAVRPAVSTEYDGLGNVVRVLARGTDDATEADDRVTRHFYDANGDRVETVDAASNRTVFELDAQGRVARTTRVAVLDADGVAADVATLHRYDAAGRTVATVDVGTGETRRLAYNAFGEIEGKSLGDGWQEFVRYSTLGKVQKTNGGDGVVRLYLHDRSGNATREITSGTADLTDVSILAAAKDASLFHTFSVYDRRNGLVRTVEPDISFRQDRTTAQAVFTQRLADLYGAIGVVGGGGGAYAQGTVDTGSHGLTRVEGSGSVALPAPATPTMGATWSVGGHPGVARAATPVEFLSTSIAWRGEEAGGTTGPMPTTKRFVVPRGLPGTECRLRDPASGAVWRDGLSVGSAVDIPNGRPLHLEARIEGCWVFLSHLSNIHEGGTRFFVQDEVMWSQTWESGDSRLLLLREPVAEVVWNEGTLTAASIATEPLRDIQGNPVPRWRAVNTASWADGTYVLTVRSSSTQASTLHVAVGDGVQVTSRSEPPVPHVRVDVRGSPYVRLLRFDESTIGSSGTVYVRPEGSGQSFRAAGMAGGAVDLAALGLARGRRYEMLVHDGSREWRGVFALDGAEVATFDEGGMLRTVARSAPILSIDATNTRSDTSAPAYQIDLTIDGITRTFDGASIAVDLRQQYVGIDDRANVDRGYDYRVYGLRGGVRQLVGQGHGRIVVGSEFAAHGFGAWWQRPLGRLLPAGSPLGGTLQVGPRGALEALPPGDWRRVALSGGELGVDLSQWIGASVRDLDVVYDAGDARFSGTFRLHPNGRVDLLGLASASRQPRIPIAVQGATALTVLRVGATDGSLQDVPPSLVAASGSTFVWDASAQAGLGPRRYRYEAVDGAGRVIGKGSGTFTLAADGSLQHAADAPELRPSSLRFTPPVGTASFTLRVRADTGAAWTSYAELPVDGPSRVFDSSPWLPASGGRTLLAKYEALDASGAVLSRGAGTLELQSDGASTSNLVEARRPTLVTLEAPPGKNVPRLVLERRDHPDGGNAVSTSIAGTWNATLGRSQFVWDASDAVPASGTKAYAYTMRLLDADGGAFRNEVGDPIVVEGVVTLGGSTSSPVRFQQFVTQLAQQAQVRRMQTFNAFGEVAEEFDDRVASRMLAMVQQEGGVADLSAARTTLAYNALGRLVAKTDPQTTVVLENGFKHRARPVTAYGYDLLGRLATSTDANGHVSRQTFAGAGERLAAAWAGDGGRRSTAHDVFGDARVLTDELGGVTAQAFDALGHLVRTERQGIGRVDNASGANAVASTLVDVYAVDAFGRRVRHTDALGTVRKTRYDTLGRVTGSLSGEGRWTTYTHAFVAAGTVGGIVGAGGRNHGGYQVTTRSPDGRETVDRIDAFGRTTWHRDLGGRTYVYAYDAGGRLASQTSSAGQDIRYAYFANGNIAEAKDMAERTLSRYGYDSAGNRVWELYAKLDASGVGPGETMQSSTIVYDELNRIARVQDRAFDVQYDYDAVGNRRAVHATYWDPLTQQTWRSEQFWYAYDAANRFTVTQGSFAGTLGTSASDTRGRIVLGTQGTRIAYDAAGRRASATTEDGARTTVESYGYTREGYLEDVRIDGTLRARRRVDAVGRTFDYTEWNDDGTRRQTKASTFDRDNRILSETTGDGTSRYFYFTDTTDAHASATQSGSGALARVEHDAANGPDATTRYHYQYWDAAKQSAIQKQGSAESTPRWAPGLSQLRYDVNGHLATATDNVAGRTLNYLNNANGLVLQRLEAVGANSFSHRWYYAAGVRIGDVSTDPADDRRVSYAEELAVSLRDLPSNTQRFRNFQPVTSADFDQSYEPINSRYPAATGGSYTVRTGDTLKSIARSLWGDQALWYLIAQANDLSGGEALVSGQVLVVPNKVANVHNNAGTFRPYEPGEVIGNVDPTLPSPRAPDGGCGTVGMIVMIVVAVVVTVYTAGAAAGAFASTGTIAGTTTTVGAASTWTAGVAALTGGIGGTTSAVVGGIAAAAVGGAVGSVASQVVGLSIGAIEDFSWKSVALSALGAGVGSGVGAAAGGLAGGSEFAASALKAGSLSRAAITAGAASAVTQAMTGKWSWRQVAASTVGAVVGLEASEIVGSAMQGASSDRGLSFMARVVGGTVSVWAASTVNLSSAKGASSKLGTIFVGALAQEVGSTFAEPVRLDGASSIGYTNGSHLTSDHQRYDPDSKYLYESGVGRFAEAAPNLKGSIPGAIPEHPDLLGDAEPEGATLRSPSGENSWQSAMPSGDLSARRNEVEDLVRISVLAEEARDRLSEGATATLTGGPQRSGGARQGAHPGSFEPVRNGGWDAALNLGADGLGLLGELPALHVDLAKLGRIQAETRIEGLRERMIGAGVKAVPSGYAETWLADAGGTARNVRDYAATVQQLAEVYESHVRDNRLREMWGDEYRSLRIGKSALTVLEFEKRVLDVHMAATNRAYAAGIDAIVSGRLEIKDGDYAKTLGLYIDRQVRGELRGLALAEEINDSSASSLWAINRRVKSEVVPKWGVPDSRIGFNLYADTTLATKNSATEQLMRWNDIRPGNFLILRPSPLGGPYVIPRAAFPSAPTRTTGRGA